jgi:hypothetical protein
MRYSASEKFEIIELAEQSSLSIRRTLAPIGQPSSGGRSTTVSEAAEKLIDIPEPDSLGG